MTRQGDSELKTVVGDDDDWSGGEDLSSLELRERPEQQSRVFDLEERTSRFGEAIIRFATRIPRNPVNDPLFSQLVAAGTSIGANYCEADDSVSKKEFRKNIGTCRKESRETKNAE